MSLTQAQIDDFEAAAAIAVAYYSGTEADVTMTDGSTVPNAVKRLAQIIAGAVLASDADGDLAGSLTLDNFLEIGDPSGASNKKRVRLVYDDGGFAIKFLKDDGAEISTPFYLSASQGIIYLDKGKVLAPQTVLHAGALVTCGSEPAIAGGMGLQNVSKLNGTGHYQIKLVNPVKDYRKAGVGITMSVAPSGFGQGLHFRGAGMLTDNSTIYWTVQDNVLAATDQQCTAHITVNDYN